MTLPPPLFSPQMTSGEYNRIIQEVSIIVFFGGMYVPIGSKCSMKIISPYNLLKRKG